ncbi:hypothetical protein CK203_057382 [Vitis vinifera]|uniref:Uncharacterized protein n=1 Tax=Vitis vinifera TaxID=29760 RepID=A0A438FUG0_VITVI|nr:hypothetical protein CK203_057382 [Vitis vinifera]
MFWRVLIFCLCRAEHKYCPTNASERSLKLSTELGVHDVIEGIVGPIVCGKLWYEESLGLVMGDMRAKGRGEHVIQPFADGANGWLVWRFLPAGRSASDRGRGARVVATGGLDLPVESELSSRGARGIGVRGSWGLALYAPGTTTVDPGYIDSGSGFEFATWPLER